MIPSDAQLAEKVIPIQRCSFCGHGNDHAEVDLLIASPVPGVHICQACVANALATLVKNRPAYGKRLKALIARL